MDDFLVHYFVCDKHNGQKFYKMTMNFDIKLNVQDMYLLDL